MCKSILNKESMKEVLLKDLELMRTEIQGIVSNHWRYSIGFIPSILGVISGATLQTFQKSHIFSIVLFLFSVYFVLAQMAAVFNYHYGYVTLVSNYIKTIEEKIKILFNGIDLIEYERNFVPVYFDETIPISGLRKKPQPFFELLIMIPSMLLFSIAIFAILLDSKFYNYFNGSVLEIIFGSSISVGLIIGIILFIRTLIHYKRLGNIENELIKFKKDKLKEFNENLFNLYNFGDSVSNNDIT
jgi:hypothetical protein